MLIYLLNLFLEEINKPWLSFPEIIKYLETSRIKTLIPYNLPSFCVGETSMGVAGLIDGMVQELEMIPGKLSF